MIYIHIPFCESFCIYCDFYSEIACGGNVGYERFTGELCAEIRRRRKEIEATRDCNTLYIGGGTPSVLPLSCLETVVRELGGAPFGEFTVEVNPEDICRRGESYVRELLGLGVTRVSMGVQSLSDDVLKWMRRRHDAAGALRAYDILRRSGVENVSVDIITGIGLPGFGKTLESTLDAVTGLAPEHVSAYQLSIEDGSALAERIASGAYTEAGEEECLEEYMHVCEKLGESGYGHYEISNWALPGFEAVHNSLYWTRHPYAGLGPGAHSLSIGEDGTQVRSWNSRALSGWTSEREVLTPEEIREEEIMLGLRTSRGFGGRVLSEAEWFRSDSIISEMI